ncbi:MAG: hypothetical protein ACQERN_11410, partial [Thermodesulfobacteriota bacterium]
QGDGFTPTHALHLTETYFDDPTDTYEIEQVDSLEIDGQDGDWEDVEALPGTGDMTIKLAQSAEGKLYVLFKAPDTNESELRLDSFGENNYGSVSVTFNMAGSWGGHYYIQGDDTYQEPTLSGLEAADTTGVEAEFPAEALDQLTRKDNLNSYYYWFFDQENEYFENGAEIKFLSESIQ